MTAVGPPAWPMTAFPETMSGTAHPCGKERAPCQGRARSGKTPTGLSTKQGSVEAEEVQAEETVRVGPGHERAPAASAGQRLEFVHRVFMRVLGMDGVALGEGEAAAEHMRGLVGKALKIHLDPPGLGIPDSVMGEAGKIEGAAELAIDARKKVEVERGGHAARIVVGG